MIKSPSCEAGGLGFFFELGPFAQTATFPLVIGMRAAFPVTGKFPKTGDRILGMRRSAKGESRNGLDGPLP
jgi:hypothetical protein